MRTAKAVLALFVSASLAMPASAQVRAAASIAGSALPRVALSAPLFPTAAAILSLSPNTVSALSPLPLAALSSPSAPALPAPAASAAAEAVPPAAPATAGSPWENPAAAPLARASALMADRLPAASAYYRWESFWTGSVARRGSQTEVDGDAPAAKSAAMVPLRRSGRGASLVFSPRASSVAAAAVLLPSAHGVWTFLAHASRFIEAGGVLVGAHFVNHGLQALLNRVAEKKGLDRNQISVIRLVSSTAVWTGAAALALIVGGAPHSTLTAAFGAGGTLLTLGLKDALGNVIQGVNFLVTRPFPIGARVQIDDQAGTISDATLTNIVVQKDDGSIATLRHSPLAAKAVIVFGADAGRGLLRLAALAKPKFKGAVGAVYHSLDRRFWLSAAAFTALLAAPSFIPFLAAGWAATALHWSLALSTVWLTKRVDSALSAAVDHLADVNSWRKETTVIARLLVSSGLWALGAGAALRLVGVTWTTLAASLGLTTLGIGLASNNFFGSIVQGAEVLLTKPFKVGDRVAIGSYSGVVEDITVYHVVLRLDEGRRAFVPYAVVRDATVVVTPAK
ncbi:MAG: mechanosensitive ion channel family protein [Elusimicrobiota bacterium]